MINLPPSSHLAKRLGADELISDITSKIRLFPETEGMSEIENTFQFRDLLLIF